MSASKPFSAPVLALSLLLAVASPSLQAQEGSGVSMDKNAAALALGRPSPLANVNLRGYGTVEFPVSGDFHGSTNGFLPTGLPGAPLNPPLVPVNIQSNKFSDVYDQLAGGGLELGFPVNSRSEFYFGIGYAKADSKGLIGLGTIGTSPFLAEFDDYKSWRLYGGVRYDLTEGKRFTPYVDGFLGASLVDDIGGRFYVPATGGQTGTVPFYDSSTTFYLGAKIGLDYAVSQRFHLGVETGVTYQTGLTDNDSLLPRSLGLTSVNREGSFLTIPIRLYGSLSF